MTGERPERFEPARAAVARLRASIDDAAARLDRAACTADRLAALRLLEAAMAVFGLHIGRARRDILLRQTKDR